MTAGYSFLPYITRTGLPTSNPSEAAHVRDSPVATTTLFDAMAANDNPLPSDNVTPFMLLELLAAINATFFCVLSDRPTYIGASGSTLPRIRHISSAKLASDWEAH